MSKDHLWYKDAVIYELHVRAFHDSVGDGVGDFRGLTQKLDYLQDLGVTALWLLPFYPSPLRDDGYDIADYSDVHPDYGTLDAFREFLAAAHHRGLRVITELVINHTSDQHRWFQRARRAPPGSPERDFYVWSDTPDKYKEVRIIFKDFETSNWTYDNVAKAYYWHRFYSHQPDLNYDNPAVWKAILPLVDYWFSMGVDGLRLDAVPYLYEREGTNCENLPETHAFLKALRKHVDERFPDRMLLAEANQWPEDAAAYFGNGDECHMAFHFPVMPRLFMAMHTEDRFPVVDILQQTPAIPETCQWTMFLRNHDELTLEMVTDEERDYMYRAYASDRRARINLGIRRRLAPLMGNNRRRIELLNGLLFSLPGTPVIYYGDEIGMGDNIYLGDRNGVRTPMQWSADRNAGFSRSNPQQLYLPIIIDPEYHYEAINVEAQQGNPSSLLWWHKRLINLRKEHSAFSRGEIRFLDPHNRKILAFVRRHENDCILVVANLSRFVQYVELDLSEFEGRRPVEVFGKSPFPAIGKLPYLLTLGPHTFYWFSLTTDSRADLCAETPEIDSRGDWERLFAREQAPQLQRLLRAYFECYESQSTPSGSLADSDVPSSGHAQPNESTVSGAAARFIRNVTVQDTFRVETPNRPTWLALIGVESSDRGIELRVVPLAFASAEEHAAWGPGDQRRLVARLSGATPGVVYVATYDAMFYRAVLAGIAQSGTLRGQVGQIVARSFVAGDTLAESAAAATVNVVHADQCNQSIVFGDRQILKLYRCVQDGIHPEVEVGEALTAAGNVPVLSAAATGELEKAAGQSEIPLAPRLLGTIEYRRRRSDPIVLGVLHEWIAHETDAWHDALDAVGRFFERMAAQNAAPPAWSGNLLPTDASAMPAEVGERFGDYLQKVGRLGARLADLHLKLAAITTPDFVPEPFSWQYQRAIYQSMRREVLDLVTAMEARIPSLADALQEPAREIVAGRDRLIQQLHVLLDHHFSAMRIRTHGDCHLGQILFTGKDFVFIDFEGVPGIPLGERRLKRSPLRDVVGMLRSFDYAVHGVLLGLNTDHGRPLGNIRAEDRIALTPWAEFWSRVVGDSFLRAYLARPGIAALLPSDRRDIQQLLQLFVRERLVLETKRELLNRPEWLTIPLTELSGRLRQPAP